MGKQKMFDPPTPKFHYKIKKRLNILSVPRKYIIDTGEGMPAYTPRGIRKSAVGGQATDRIVDAAWPYVRRFVLIKRMYKNRFSLERLERIDKMMETANATCYSKLANCVLDLKKADTKDVKKKKGWSESEWKKHMEYISQIADPRPDFQPPPTRNIFHNKTHQSNQQSRINHQLGKQQSYNRPNQQTTKQPSYNRPHHQTTKQPSYNRPNQQSIKQPSNNRPNQQATKQNHSRPIPQTIETASTTKRPNQQLTKPQFKKTRL